MRLDDYQKWLDAQFVDESDRPEVRAPEEEEAKDAMDYAAAPVAEEHPADASGLTAEPLAATPAFLKHEAPEPNDDSAIPALDDYIPFLRPRAPEHPVVSPPETAPEAALAQEDSQATAFEPTAGPARMAETSTAAAPAASPTAEARAMRPRARHARPAAAVGSAKPLDPDRLWNLVPKHLQVLIAMDSNDDEVAQNSYKRQFKESRIDLISRLLDPTLSLEDTARVLNVCPTTVRRYTNKGLLTHQRTQGDQRRFKLSDVLAFLEAQSRKES